MEALKKAEEAKRLASEGHAPAATFTSTPELTLKPLVTPTGASASSSGSPLPDLSLHIDSVDADLAAVSTEAPLRKRAPENTSRPPDTGHHEATERTAARNVFAAKQPPKSRALLWLILGLIVLAALGIGGYFWWQLQSVSVNSLARPAQPLEAPTPRPAQTAELASVEIAKRSPEPEPLPRSAPTAQKTAPNPAQQIARSERLKKSPSNVTPATPDSPVRLSKSQPRSNTALERAYDSLQAGHMEEAQRGYEQVLRNDAKNTDALLGLATIAALQGQTERAQAYYLRALESDPNDATAQAGVINTRGLSDPGQSESRLKTALASQPDSSALHFALGNLYARQLRWSEAQQAYFRAYSTEPDNADFIFNLAVSLDHLHQNKLAAQYYQMALNAAGAANASFDKNQIKNRVLELQP
jgi:Tfp pilus assembly protein PilF